MSKSPTVVVTDTRTLSGAVDKILDKMTGSDTPPTKSALLNILAAQIAGPKHNWGYLTGATGPVYGKGLPAGARTPARDNAPVSTRPEAQIVGEVDGHLHFKVRDEAAEGGPVMREITLAPRDVITFLRIDAETPEVARLGLSQVLFERDGDMFIAYSQVPGSERTLSFLVDAVRLPGRALHVLDGAVRSLLETDALARTFLDGMISYAEGSVGEIPGVPPNFLSRVIRLSACFSALDLSPSDRVRLEAGGVAQQLDHLGTIQEEMFELALKIYNMDPIGGSESRENDSRESTAISAPDAFDLSFGRFMNGGIMVTFVQSGSGREQAHARPLGWREVLSLWAAGKEKITFGDITFDPAPGGGARIFHDVDGMRISARYSPTSLEALLAGQVGDASDQMTFTRTMKNLEAGFELVCESDTEVRETIEDLEMSDEQVAQAIRVAVIVHWMELDAGERARLEEMSRPDVVDYVIDEAWSAVLDVISRMKLAGQ